MKKQLPNKTKVGLIAGGTGITPLFSIAQASCLANDKLNIKLIYSNKTKKDVLLHKELSQLSQ
jgi:ferredoxin-NADP reductase